MGICINELQKIINVITMDMEYAVQNFLKDNFLRNKLDVITS